MLALAAGPFLIAATPAGPYEATRALDADLTAHDSATATLTRRCADRRWADPARITAVRSAGEAAAPDAEVRAELGVGPSTPVGYRHVRLTCGGHVLSDARNWYLPGRLTAEMNRVLETTDTPFGTVVAPLGFHRRRLASRLLVAPGETAAPPVVLEHRAVLVDAAGVPFAYVIERYTRELVAGR